MLCFCFQLDLAYIYKIFHFLLYFAYIYDPIQRNGDGTPENHFELLHRKERMILLLVQL